MTGARLYSLILSCRKFVIHTVVYFEYIALNAFQSHVEVRCKTQASQVIEDEYSGAENTKLSEKQNPFRRKCLSSTL
jgi:hypothetical protein